MAKAVLPEVIDGSLDRIRLSATLLTVCSQQPTTYTEGLTTYKLADVVIDSGDLTIANGDISGRKLTVGQQSSILVDSSGTANHIALLDVANQRLLLVTTCNSAALTAGQTTTVPSFELEISGNLLPAPSAPAPEVAGYPKPGMYIGPLTQQAWLDEENAHMAPMPYECLHDFCGDGWDNAMAPRWVVDHWAGILEDNPEISLMLTYAAPPKGLDTGWPQAIDEYYAIFTQIINGAHDGKAYQLADNLVNSGLAAFGAQNRLWLSQCHEANGDWYPWNWGFAGGRARWVAAWKRFASKVRERLIQRLGPNHGVKIGWCGVIDGQIYENGQKIRWPDVCDDLGVYNASTNPGGIEFLAFDNYAAAWGMNLSGDALWNHQKRIGGGLGSLDYCDYARAKGLPLSINEWGPWGLGGQWGGSFDDPIWVRRIFENVIRSGAVHRWHQWNVVGPEGGSSQLGADSPYPLSKAEYKTQALALYHEHH